MKIVSSGMQMASSHASAQQHEVKESLRMWVGDRRPDFEGRGRLQPVSVDTVRISDAGRAAQGSEAAAVEEAMDETQNDPRLTLLRAMLRYFTGQDVEIFDARDLQPDHPPPDLPQAPASSPRAPTASPPAGWGVEYERHESYTEVEETSFSASGAVLTADGREIGFSLDLTMSRSYHEESDVSLRLGDAARPQKDPLVINFGGSAAQLLDQRFRFDLDADGTTENINRLASGSGFLVFDRNGDGKANDGSELFGTRSGDGFADLAQFDGDNNGWIDENDTAWAALRVWTPDSDGGGELRPLLEANVGAIALARVATPFALKDGENTTLGEVRSTGLYLQEDGGVGSVQQVDLSV